MENLFFKGVCESCDASITLTFYHPKKGNYVIVEAQLCKKCSEAIKSEAYDDGYREGHDAGEEKGFEDGIKEGRAEEKTDVDEYGRIVRTPCAVADGDPHYTGA